MHRLLTVSAAAVATTLAVSSVAPAAIIVQDSFLTSESGDDAAGVYNDDSDIVGQSPDTLGFDAAVSWSVAGTGARSSIVQSSGLQVGSLVTGGGSVVYTQTGGTGTGSSSITRPTATSTTGGASRFISYLISRSSVATGDTVLNVTRNGTTGTQGPLDIGLAGDELNLFYRTSNGTNNNTVTTTNANLSADTTYLLTLEVNADGGTGGADQLIARLFNADDTLAIGGESASLLVNDANVFDTANGSIAAVQPRTRNYTVGQSFTFDEIRIGTTFADVVPVPEPTAVAGLAGLGLLGLRRRRA